MYENLQSRAITGLEVCLGEFRKTEFRRNIRGKSFLEKTPRSHFRLSIYTRSRRAFHNMLAPCGGDLQNSDEKQPFISYSTLLHYSWPDATIDAFPSQPRSLLLRDKFGKFACDLEVTNEVENDAKDALSWFTHTRVSYESLIYLFIHSFIFHG